MYKDDEKWVTEQIVKIHDPQIRVKVWQAYKKVFDETFDNEPMEHKKENKARFAANNRLRIFVKNNQPD